MSKQITSENIRHLQGGSVLHKSFRVLAAGAATNILDDFFTK